MLKITLTKVKKNTVNVFFIISLWHLLFNKWNLIVKCYQIFLLTYFVLLGQISLVHFGSLISNILLCHFYMNVEGQHYTKR